jgi:EAL domain-containing protein (putative c-di-GMP-specific phosphodiesterase class I)
MVQALAEEQFIVYLQPKYSLETNAPAGAEALVRWMHPEKGMISPGLFIPVFEKKKTGLLKD